MESVKVMLRQICMDYNALPPIMEMDIDQILFFYKGSIDSWRASSKG